MITYTGGTFDLFHAGHVQFLKKCSTYGRVVVALNTDEFVKEFKGKPPVMTFAERYEVLRACKYVDEVIANISGADSKPTITSVMPDIIIVGSDWEKKDYCKQMQFTQGWLDKQGIKLIYVPYTGSISTTEIKKRLLK
jgi:glycerol-3-phosphate cytidylyltransferase